MAQQLNEQEVQYAHDISENMSKLPAAALEAGIAVLRYDADAETEARDRQVSLDDVESAIGQIRFFAFASIFYQAPAVQGALTAARIVGIM